MRENPAVKMAPNTQFNHFKFDQATIDGIKKMSNNTNAQPPTKFGAYMNIKGQQVPAQQQQ